MQRIMDTTITVWICVAAAMAAIIIFRVLRTVMHRQTGENHHHHRFIELGSEREEIWIPGDRLISHNDRYDDSEDF